jgi:maleate cis-trans isomerase
MRAYGWRARIGHIYPAVVAETFMHEFYRIVPPGVTLAQTNLIIQSLNEREGLEASIKRIDEAAEYLAKRKVDIITIGGSPMFRLMGVGSDKVIIDRLANRFGIPVTTNQTAAVEAFKTLGVKKIAVAAPYFDYQNEQVKKFLEGSGLEVVHINGLSTEIEAIHELPLEASYHHARKVFFEAPHAEAVYIPCAHFAVPWLQELENDLQVPVVSSTTALIWHCFKILKIRASITGYGSLLASLSEEKED